MFAVNIVVYYVVDFLNESVIDEFLNGVFARTNHIGNGVALEHSGQHRFVRIESTVPYFYRFAGKCVIILVKIVLQIGFTVDVIFPVVDDKHFVVRLTTAERKGANTDDQTNSEA